MTRISSWAVSLLLLASVAWVRPSRASADIMWCWNDPVLVIDGKVIRIEVGVPLGQHKTVSDSVLVVVVPANVNATLSGTRAANFPLGVTLVKGSPYSGSGPVPVTVSANVAAMPGTPTVMRAVQPSDGIIAQTTGVAGTMMKLAFHVE